MPLAVIPARAPLSTGAFRSMRLPTAGFSALALAPVLELLLRLFVQCLDGCRNPARKSKGNGDEDPE